MGGGGGDEEIAISSDINLDNVAAVSDLLSNVLLLMILYIRQKLLTLDQPVYNISLSLHCVDYF